MKTILRSDELSCPSCVAGIEASLGAIRGVSKAAVSFNTGRIEVEHETGVPTAALVEAVRRAGYQARVAPF